MLKKLNWKQHNERSWSCRDWALDVQYVQGEWVCRFDGREIGSSSACPSALAVAEGFIKAKVECGITTSFQTLIDLLAARDARIAELEAALRGVRDFRHIAWLYDDDMGHPRREFCNDTVALMEDMARDALKETPDD
jgi:hypothetical protein